MHGKGVYGATPGQRWAGGVWTRVCRGPGLGSLGSPAASAATEPPSSPQIQSLITEMVQTGWPNLTHTHTHTRPSIWLAEELAQWEDPGAKAACFAGGFLRLSWKAAFELLPLVTVAMLDALGCWRCWCSVLRAGLMTLWTRRRPTKPCLNPVCDPQRSGQIPLGWIKMATCPQTGALPPAGEASRKSSSKPGPSGRHVPWGRVHPSPCDTCPPIVSLESKDSNSAVRGFRAQSLVDLHEVCVLQ